MAYSYSLWVAVFMQRLLRGAEVNLWCWKGFGYLNTDWKRLEIPATLKGFGCSETLLAWSSSPLDPSLIKCVVLQRDAAIHGGM